MANSQVAEFMQILSGYSIVELSKMLRRSQVELADLFVRYDGNVEKIAKAKGVASNTIPKQLNRLKNALEPKKPELTEDQQQIFEQFAADLDKEQYQIDKITKTHYKCRNGYYTGFVTYITSNQRLKSSKQTLKFRFDIKLAKVEILSDFERMKSTTYSTETEIYKKIYEYFGGKDGVYHVNPNDLPPDIRRLIEGQKRS